MRRSSRLVVATLLVLPVLSVQSTSTASAALTSFLVDEAFMVETTELGAEYDSAIISVHIDPANTNWIAWNDTPTVSHTDETLPGETFLWGGSAIGTNDFIRLTITAPDLTSEMVAMDLNNLLGQNVDPTLPMNVIYGDSTIAPDALRIDVFGDTAGMRFTFDEDGAFNSIFTSAGLYEFHFSFVNLIGAAGHTDIYLLVDTMDIQPPAIPEPSTLALLVSGLGGVGFWRRRRQST